MWPLQITVQLALLFTTHLHLSTSAVQASPLNLFPRANAPDSQITSFCSKFNDACKQACMQSQKSGKISITYLCTKEQGKNSLNFGCSCDDVDSTNAILSALDLVSEGADDPVTTTKTTQQTQVKTISKDVTSTHTNKLPSVTTQTSTTMLKTLSLTSTSTKIVGTALTTLTFPHGIVVTQYPTTTSTATLVSTQTSTSGQTTSYTMPSMSFIARSEGDAQRLSSFGVTVSKNKSAGSSTFCDAYAASCQRDCDSRSGVATQSCKLAQAGSDSDQYSLACKCKSGLDETLHALNHIDNYPSELITKSFTDISTSTKTRFNTIVKETTITPKDLSTVTEILTVAGKTLNFKETVSLSKTVTKSVTKATTVSTFTAPTATVTASTQTATTAVVASSTLIVLLPTGIIRGQSTLTGSSVEGYLNIVDGKIGWTTDKTAAVSFAIASVPSDQRQAPAGTAAYGLVQTSDTDSWVSYPTISEKPNDDPDSSCGSGFLFMHPMGYTDQYLGGFVTDFFGVSAPELDTVDQVQHIQLTPEIFYQGVADTTRRWRYSNFNGQMATLDSGCGTTFDEKNYMDPLNLWLEPISA